MSRMFQAGNGVKARNRPFLFLGIILAVMIVGVILQHQSHRGSGPDG